MPRPITLLWIFEVFVCFLDYPAITVGGSVLKVAFAVCPVICTYVLLWNHLNVNRTLLLLASLFVGCILPSVALSTNFITSIKFLLGVVACLSIMVSMYSMTRAIGAKSVDILVWIYRVSVVVTIPLFALRLQERGHFTFYEASYWAIAMIPYYCIAFHKLLTGMKRAFAVDALFIVTAIAVSQSVSMVLWILMCFAGMLIAMRKVRISYLLASVVVCAILGVVTYTFSERVQVIASTAREISDLDSLAGLTMLIAGNRVQRVLVAYRAVQDHFFFGVGLGALKDFTDLHFRAADFSVFGSSAPDFDISEPATNIFLELAAECGIFGFAAFLVLLRYIFKQCKNKPAVVPFHVALWVTMLSLMIESSYLRPYVWMLYGISLGLSSLAASSASFAKAEAAQPDGRSIRAPLHGASASQPAPM